MSMEHFRTAAQMAHVAQAIADGDDPQNLKQETMIRLLISCWACQMDAEQESRQCQKRKP